MEPRYLLSFLTGLDAPSPAAVLGAAGTGDAFIGLRLLPAAPGDGAIDLVGLFAALPPDLPVSVELPDEKQAPAPGAREWARRALAKSRAVLSRADGRREAAAHP